MDRQLKRGRPKVQRHEKRMACHGIRLPAYWLFYLQNRPESCGKLIEKALEKCYGTKFDKDELINKFYGRQ